MKPVLSGFSQLAYATNDLEHALAIYSEQYGIPSFHRLEAQIFARVGDRVGQAELTIALANVRGVNIEVIEATKDVGGFFTSAISGMSGFAIALHHVCQRLEGGISNWDAHLANLQMSGREIALHGDVGDHARLVFTDDRKMLGAYIEHLWMTPVAWQEIDRNVPFHGD